eukprot:GHVU01118847.1.p2 GENE.GHVU01118847.1~~GHVU01118847.1.p2  ORF type:complete len:129 (+),score=14.04 GHVU01118847.1:39-389(+)
MTTDSLIHSPVQAASSSAKEAYREGASTGTARYVPAIDGAARRTLILPSVRSVLQQLGFPAVADIRLGGVRRKQRGGGGTPTELAGCERRRVRMMHRKKTNEPNRTTKGERMADGR